MARDASRGTDESEREIDAGAGEETQAAVDADHEAYAWVDDGEYATVYGVDRVGDETVEVTCYREEAGLVEQDGEPERYDVSADKTTLTFARKLSGVDPSLALEVARDYWGDDK